jgi:DNA-binding protein H-NS
MATLAELQKRIARLQEEAEQVRKSELASVIASIREAVAQYDLTPADIFGRKAGPSARAKGAGTAGGKAPRPPKYRDPKTGKTWTGMGKPPNWIAGVRNRDKFLIDAQAADEASQSEPATRGKKRRKLADAGTKTTRKATKKGNGKSAASSADATEQSSSGGAAR